MTLQVVGTAYFDLDEDPAQLSNKWVQRPHSQPVMDLQSQQGDAKAFQLSTVDTKTYEFSTDWLYKIGEDAQQAIDTVNTLCN
jgi:hypothetical protein